MKVAANQIELLKEKLFPNLDVEENEFERFCSHWNKVEFKKGEFITQKGEVEKYVYFVVEGVQKLFFIDQKGKEHVLGFSFDNSLSGVPDSMISQTKSQFTVQAIVDSKFLRIDRNIFFEYIDNNPTFERWWRKALEQILLGRVNREVEIISCSAEERFDILHKRSPRAIQLIPQKDLASYLSMTAETYSRLRAKYLS